MHNFVGDGGGAQTANESQWKRRPTRVLFETQSCKRRKRIIKGKVCDALWYSCTQEMDHIMENYALSDEF